MNKRSAMLVAAGLVLTLVVGGVAVAVGMTGPSASSAQPKLTQHRKNKPIVKTTKKTVTVHKKAQAGVVVAAPAPSTGTMSSSGSGSSYDDSSSSGSTYGDDSSPSDEPSESEDPGGSDDEPSDEPSGGTGVEDD